MQPCWRALKTGGGGGRTNLQYFRIAQLTLRKEYFKHAWHNIWAKAAFPIGHMTKWSGGLATTDAETTFIL